jgi:predicted secreted protein
MEDKLENTPTTLKRRNVLDKRKGRGGNLPALLPVIIFLAAGIALGVLTGYLLWGRNLTPLNPNKESGLTEESSTDKEGQVVIPGEGNLAEVFGEDVVFFVRFPGTVNLKKPEATREAIRQFIEKERTLRAPFLQALAEEKADIPVRLVVVDQGNQKLCEVYLTQEGGEPSWFFPGLEKPKEYQQLMQNLFARLKLQEAGYAQDYLLCSELSEDSTQMSAFEEMAKLAGEGSAEDIVPQPGGRSFTVSFKGEDKVRKFSLDLGFNERTLELEVQQIAEIE